MNIQEFREYIIDNYGRTMTLSELLDKYSDLLKSNVIIPKGINRHPYADVLHAGIEGSPIEARFPRNENGKWTFASMPSFDFEYRIKPQETVYEWQWMYKFKNGNEFLFTTYQTEEENAHFMSTIDKNSLGESSKKIEETKRVRQ